MTEEEEECAAIVETMGSDEPIFDHLLENINLDSTNTSDTLTTDPTEEDKSNIKNIQDKQSPENPCHEPIDKSSDLPTTFAKYTDVDTLSLNSLNALNDVDSEFFEANVVNSKNDTLENEMLITELVDNVDNNIDDGADNDELNFRSQPDEITNCHQNISNKVLYDISDSEDKNCTRVVDDDVTMNLDNTDVGDSTVSSKETECTSLNKMHTMEDVEEGSDMSSALPSSPGHAEQRPEATSPVAGSAGEPEAAATKESTDASPSAADENVADVANISDATPPEPEPERDMETKGTDAVLGLGEAGEESDYKCGSGSLAAEVADERDESKDDRDDMACKEEDSTSGGSSPVHNKRKIDDEESPVKRLRTQVQQRYADHDRILAEYMESVGCNTLDELQSHVEQLLAEIRTLNELAREKEREWNNILHLRKVKEELLLRMQRRRHVLLLSSEDGAGSVWDASDSNTRDISGSLKQNGNNMSTSGATSRATLARERTKPRSILPKPAPSSVAAMLSAAAVDNGAQNGGECRQGRQGPILDVRSIIADYRQRHPETVPRRGRRLKSVLNASQSGNGAHASNSVLSMANLALGSGSQMRQVDHTAADLGLLLSAIDNVPSRPSSADSSGGSVYLQDSALSFKDVLVQFARLSQSERQELQSLAQAKAQPLLQNAPHTQLIMQQAPPPYPEVTLHPVQGGLAAVASSPVTVSAAVTSSSSLLHGILTKSQPKSDPKSTTFSPTLARLLTAPERAPAGNGHTVCTATATLANSAVSIADLLTTATTKSRHEITITPVGQFGPAKILHKDREHIEEEEAEDSVDRLVIDEGIGDGSDGRGRTDAGSDMGDEVPQCQGCHQKSAQFVCAGCGNQWYCSRDCQVAAWDEHSEVCSG